MTTATKTTKKTGSKKATSNKQAAKQPEVTITQEMLDAAAVPDDILRAADAKGDKGVEHIRAYASFADKHPEHAAEFFRRWQDNNKAQREQDVLGKELSAYPLPKHAAELCSKAIRLGVNLSVVGVEPDDAGEPTSFRLVIDKARTNRARSGSPKPRGRGASYVYLHNGNPVAGFGTERTIKDYLLKVLPDSDAAKKVREHDSGERKGRKSPWAAIVEDSSLSSEFSRMSKDAWEAQQA